MPNLSPTKEPTASRALNGLPNIGTTIAARLAAAGIRTIGDLRAIGPPEAYRRVSRQNPARTIPVCYYLYALQGALDGVPWNAVPAGVKKRLRELAGVERRRRSDRGRIRL